MSARIGNDEVRRRQLIEATIDALADLGFASASLSEIAARASVAPSLVAHYFRDKDGLLEATLRFLAARIAQSSALRLGRTQDPLSRIHAVIDANLAPEEFDRRTCSVWLAFWSQVPHSPRLRRVQQAYQRRMLSNLRHDLRALVAAPDAERIAVSIAAVIDGLWLRSTLSGREEIDQAGARAMAMAFAQSQISDARPATAVSRLSPIGGSKVRSSFIAGRPSPSGGEASVSLLDPSTESVLARFVPATARDRERAFSQAVEAQRLWVSKSSGERSEILGRVAVRLRESRRELAALEARESGVPVSQVDLRSIALAIDAWGRIAQPEWQSDVGLTWDREFGAIRRDPLGVVTVQDDEAMPFQSVVSASAFALKSGNAVIIEPSASTPLFSLRFAEMASESGLPDGMCNVLLTDAGAELEDAGIRETFIGRHRIQPAKSCLVVLDGADVEGAARAAFRMAFQPMRRDRAAGVVLFVQTQVQERFTASFLGLASSARMGSPLDPQTEIGPLRTHSSLQRSLRLIDGARGAGGRVLLGGERSRRPGWFLQPTILDHFARLAGILDESIEGPIAPIVSVSDASGVLEHVVNDSPRNAWIFGADLSAAGRLAERIRADRTWVNPRTVEDIDRDAMHFNGIEEERAGARFSRIRYVQFGFDAPEG